MKNFNVRFEDEITAWKEKYNQAKIKTESLDKNNLLIVADFGLKSDYKAKIKQVIELYRREKHNFKDVKVVIPSCIGIMDIDELSAISSEDLFFVFDNPQKSLEENSKAFISAAAKCAYKDKKVTYGTVYQVSSPENMYSNMLTFIENGILPLNVSAPNALNINIFEEITSRLLQQISGLDFNWFVANHPEMYDFWQKKYHDAVKNMTEATQKKNDKPKILIECAAQHPLINGMFPGEEFAARLDKAILLYHEAKNSGKEAKIYIPGSIHQIWVEGVKHEDMFSLSLAGEMYLKSRGIPEEDIYGEKVNKKLMPQGVYNSADECRVASKIFKSKNFNELICVTSPGQLYRVGLFYLNFGVIPQMYTAPTKTSYHNVINEITGSIPNVMINCPSWQLKSSYEDATSIDNQIAEKSRNERNPIDYLLTHTPNL